ncbi:MAG TPA: phosphomannomutase/phosphoglucomutase [Candidatus Faeciplasma gallinarum]|uniref:Phosphomannomutase/phosphoglucomutase n=1 Tax=Candidatus Faeciplasma gallinarum TaxID=2840799 RepID=A0A9D1EMW6_9FIRM|nr:phosphomannomutase/phosphoglucomutase [Candidatus Faeciplasma gallinarum]
MKDYSKLRNESDIRGIAIEGVPGQEVNLTEQACRDIGRGFALWLIQRSGKTSLRVAVGRDSRLSGGTLLEWIADEMSREGINVTDMGLTSTPAMFMTTKTEGYMFDGAVMVTASHLPYNRNGYKFFTPDGGVEASDIKDMIALAESDKHSGLTPAGVEKGEFMSVYAKRLADMIRQACNSDKPLEGLKIVVDAGNGAGGFYAEDVLLPLGADITGSRYLNPDGRFPNHIPNPENEEAMASITEAVLGSNADLGIIFDTDVDRAGAVLSDGSELNRNRLIAMLSAMLLRDHPGTTIVTDSVTSSGLAKFIAEKGGVHHRFKRGYRNVINEAIRLNKEGIDSQLAIETSGHGAFKENYFLDDGAYIVTKLIIELSRANKMGYTLHSLIQTLEEPKESMEFRMNLELEDFKPYGNEIISRLTEYAKTKQGWSLAPSNYEGIRVNLDDSHGNGWFLLRMSLHEPLMPLNIESDSVGGVKVIAGELSEFISQFDKLDSSKLVEYAK